MDTNHILLPTTYFEVQSPIMNISLNIQMNTTHNKHKMKMGEKNELLLNNYQNNSIFIDNNPYISYLVLFLSSSYLNVKISAFWSIRRFGYFRILFFTALSTTLTKLLFVVAYTTSHCIIILKEFCHNSNKGVNDYTCSHGMHQEVSR